MRALFGAGLLLAVACVSAPAPAPEQAVEQFMWNYTQAWNRHDSAAIARDFYRTGPSIEEQTASLERGFENLRGQGYKQSAIHEVKACITGPDTAWAAMKFSRLKADGEPLPPRERASSYTLKKFADGWRITGLGGAAADRPLACPAAA